MDDSKNSVVRPPPDSTEKKSAVSWWREALFVGCFGLGVAGLFLISENVFVGAILSTIGLLIVGATVSWCVSTRRFLRRAIPAAGIIVGFEERPEEEEGERKYSITIGFLSWSFGPKEERRIRYFPRVAFETKDHEKRIFTSDDGSREPSHHVGDVVRVFYDPAQPQVARINEPIWVFAAAGVIGVSFLAPGLWHLLNALGFLE